MHPCSVDELEIIRYRMAITIALYIHIDRVRAGHCKVINQWYIDDMHALVVQARSISGDCQIFTFLSYDVFDVVLAYPVGLSIYSF